MERKIKYLVMDVDGTLTDGKIYVGNNGELFKAFNIKDGCGIKDILIPSGIEPIILTGRKSEILKIRCKELDILKLFQGVDNKEELLERFLFENNSNFSSVAYIGDDINDLSCMKKIKSFGGIIGCPADSDKNVIYFADYICSKNGGCGAVREFIEWLLFDNKA